MVPFLLQHVEHFHRNFQVDVVSRFLKPIVRTNLHVASFTFCVSGANVCSFYVVCSTVRTAFFAFSRLIFWSCGGKLVKKCFPVENGSFMPIGVTCLPRCVLRAHVQGANHKFQCLRAQSYFYLFAVWKFSCNQHCLAENHSRRTQPQMPFVSIFCKEMSPFLLSTFFFSPCGRVLRRTLRLKLVQKTDSGVPWLAKSTFLDGK